jgi:hypothetical protein
MCTSLMTGLRQKHLDKSYRVMFSKPFNQQNAYTEGASFWVFHLIACCCVGNAYRSMMLLSEPEVVLFDACGTCDD